MIARLLASNWQRALVALALGALSAFALPPYYVVLLLWPALGGLLLLILSAQSIRRAVLEGWLFGCGFFAVGLYWIGHAFLVDAERFAHLMPAAVISISIGMALFVAAATGLSAFIIRRFDVKGFAVVPTFAGVWTVMEWVRGWLFTGFPWNPMASVWGFSVEIMQSAAFVGALGLSFLTVLVFAAPALWLRSANGAPPLRMILAATVLVPLLWINGALRLGEGDTATMPDLTVRLIQPAIAQQDKWKPDLRRSHVIKQMAMSKRTSGPAGDPNVVIWSETNVPFVIGPDSTLPSTLAAAVPPGGFMIFGAPRRAEDGTVYNSLFMINGNGDILAEFDKFHLVPFGEYVPLRGLLPFDKLVEGRGDFTAGPGPQTIRVPGLPAFAPIICYEVIFSGNVVDAADRPDWILNITNDAWFGPSAGPRQHLVQAQFRAIEEGLPMVRVANTGISAVIDPHGRIRNFLDLDTQGILDAPLPEPLPPTVFSKTGPLIGLALALFALAASILNSRRGLRAATRP